MSSMEREHKLRGQIMAEKGISDEQLDTLIKNKIDELNGFINELAALVLIAKDQGMDQKDMKIFSPEEKVRAKLTAKISPDKLDEMITILQKQSVYFKKNILLAYEFIAKKLDIAIFEDLGEMARAESSISLQQWIDSSDKTIGNAEGMVVNQKVQRKKGGDWSTLYVTTIMDHKGDVLQMKTWNKEKDFSPYFLRVGKWYTFFGVKKEIGKEREDGSFWQNTYWWYGEAESIDSKIIPPATSIVVALDPYKIYVLEGVISNFRKVKGWTAHNPYKDKCVSSQSINPPEEEEIGEQPGFKTMDYHQKYRFTLNTIDGRIECSVMGFPFLLRAKGIYTSIGGVKESLKTDVLDDYKVRLIGNILDGSDSHERLYMVRGLLSIVLSEDTGLAQVDSLLDKLIEQGYVNLDVPSQPQKTITSKLVAFEDIPIDALIEWYMKQQKTNTMPIQLFKDDLWKGFGIAVSDQTVMEIIQVLIAEGLVKKSDGVHMYPNT